MSALATELAGAERDLRLARTPAPAAIVIFGATGDLTQRKLMPGLYSLAVQQLLPPETAIIGAARTELTDDAFRAMIREGLSEVREVAGAIAEMTGKPLVAPEVVRRQRLPEEAEDS